MLQAPLVLQVTQGPAVVLCSLRRTGAKALPREILEALPDQGKPQAQGKEVMIYSNR